MSRKKMHVFGVDIGGTKIRSGIFDHAMNCLWQQDLPSAGAAGRDALLQVLDKSVAQLQHQAGTLGITSTVIGISSAGVIDRKTGLVLDATDAIPDWRGTPLAVHAATFSGLPVVVENDVKAALVGELSRRPDIAMAHVVMLTLGTGLGGAISRNGVIENGSNKVAGHFGRMLIPSPWAADEWTTVESVVSGTGLFNIARFIYGMTQLTDAKDVLQACSEQHPLAIQALERFCDALAAVVENIYWSQDPDQLIVGGGLVDASSHWWSELQQRLAARGVPLPVSAARLSNDAGMYGAACLALASMNGDHHE